MGAPSSDSAGIRQVIRALRAAGYVLDSVYDGEEDVDVSNEPDAVEAILAVDDAYLHVVPDHNTPRATPLRNGWVRFVMGNEPQEVVNDYTTNLEHALGPVFDRWEDED